MREALLAGWGEVRMHGRPTARSRRGTTHLGSEVEASILRGLCRLGCARARQGAGDAQAATRREEKKRCREWGESPAPFASPRPAHPKTREERDTRPAHAVAREKARAFAVTHQVPIMSSHLHLLSRGGQASASRVGGWAPPPATRPPPAATVRPSRRSGGCGVVAVIPMLGPNGRRAPPDLASFLLKERIVYLVSVTGGGREKECARTARVACCSRPRRRGDHKRSRRHSLSALRAHRLPSHTTPSL